MAADVQPRIDALLTSTQALDHTIAKLTDDEARGASLLPHWSRGHVLTHIARNADAMVNLLAWARTGQETPMYASREKRDADIEAGASRPVAELVSDVQDSHERLCEDMSSLPTESWAAVVRYGAAGRERPAAAIPTLRRTEVEIHHVDLDLDYTLAHWPEDFVELTLDETVADYSQRDEMSEFVLVSSDSKRVWTVGDGGPEITGPPPALLGWLIGRSDGTGLYCDGPLPDVGVWR